MRHISQLSILIVLTGIIYLAGCSKDPAPPPGITGVWGLTTSREVDRTDGIVTYDSTFREAAGGTVLTFTADGHAYYSGFAVYTDTSTYRLTATTLTFHNIADSNTVIIDSLITLTAHALIFRETDAQGVTSIQHTNTYTR